MIEIILSHQIFRENPPVLFDFGAAGDIRTEWAPILTKSILYRLDANNNIFKNKFKNKEVAIKSVISTKSSIKNFFITASSDCSSLLIPNLKELNNWILKDKFLVKKKIKAKTKTIKEIIKINKINKIDWVKLDLQGIDLDIFKSIPKSLRNEIIIAEFEPGLYNFYKGENTLCEILNYMEKDYYIDDFFFGKSIRVNSKIFETFNFLQKKSINLINKKTNFYTNITFIKKNLKKTKKHLRSILLLISILILKKRYLEVLEIVNNNKNLDPIFSKIKKFILFKINISILLYFTRTPFYLFKKLTNFFKTYL